MPIYEYHCEKCDNLSDWMGAFKDRPEYIVCEHCGHKKAQRIISTPNVTVKSGGGLAGADEDFSKSKTIGEFWDRRGLHVGSEKNKEANKKRVQKMRKKAMKNDKK